MVLDTSEYNENYFNGRNTGIKLSWGYGDIRESGQLNRVDEGDNNPYNATHKELFDRISFSLVGKKVLDIGGCVGNFAHLGKGRRGATQWDVLDLNIDGWCEANKRPEVSNFITGDAPVILKERRQFKNGDYDVIFTHQFLECLDGTRLSDTITEMNRIAGQQIHIITESVTDIPSKDKYNLNRISPFWSTQGFNTGTILISWNTGTVTVV